MAPPSKPGTPTGRPQSNTLFNYFNRTPRTPPNNPDAPHPLTRQKDTPTGRNNRVIYSSDEEFEENQSPTGAMRLPKGSGQKRPKSKENSDRRLVESSDEEGAEERKENSEAGAVPKEPEVEAQEEVKRKTPKSGKRAKRKRSSTPPETPATEEKRKKRRARVIESGDEDSGSAYEPSNEEDEEEEEESESEKSAVEMEVSEPESEDEKPKKKGAKKALATTPRSSSKPTVSTPSGSGLKPKPTAAASSSKDKEEGVGGPANWPHLTFEWLKPEKIRDGKGRLKGSEGYDPTTLMVPTTFMEKLTPAHVQWWSFKKEHFDTVLFFKMGKFYEFFHMDAVLAVEVLGCQFMKGECAHAGFPEAAYSAHSNKFVERGYKIARIEQTENPEAMNQRLADTRKKGGKVQTGDKAVIREICEIATKGVRLPSFLHDPYNSPFSPDAKYLYSICEKVDVGSGKSTFGVSFIDTTIGIFRLGQFEDDRHFSRLRTLLCHYPPAQILTHKKKNMGNQADKLISSYAGMGVLLEESPNEFKSPHQVLNFLKEGQYFYVELDKECIFPDVLKHITTPGHADACPGYDLAIKALGDVVLYLKYCLAEHDLLSLRKFEIYRPIDTFQTRSPVEDDAPTTKVPKFMVLDAITLHNLDILESTSSSSLISFVDNCHTAFGKRLLREWLCMPLAIPKDIQYRLDAVDELMECQNKLSQAGDIVQNLKSLPDLDRLLAKVHTLGSKHRSKNHPEGRASFFEEIKYSRNKVVDLIAVIKGFRTCQKIIEFVADLGPMSAFLKDLVKSFPDLNDYLKYFENAFDPAAAQKDGKILPKQGVDDAYDDALDAIKRVEKESRRYLEEIGTQYKCKAVWFGSDKRRFQLEVPDRVSVPREFELSSQRKGFKRYVNATTKKFLEKVQKAETIRDDALKDITRRIFEQFDQSYDVWKSAVNCIAKLDVLYSFATFSNSEPDLYRPIVLYPENDINIDEVRVPPPFLRILDGRHPCMSADTYISNDCFLGDYAKEGHGTFMLLTGPNMGGKSTLMRQVALIVILAQIGCFVPSPMCELTVVDRIFTRLGAADNIGEGESTFFVELSEASAVLRHCTPNSLVLMDELGRGTATYDGTAIAYSVATELSAKKVRTLFSTHYHSLVESMQHMPNVQLAHMSCMVENENESDPTEETITFLYKIASGACPKSYGFNAAKLAGLPAEIIKMAYQKAKEFEEETEAVSTFRNIFQDKENALETALKLLSFD